jgi:hypothetical protein
MASFNQAVNIPEPQDSIMVVKIKHSARGLADAPQANADDPQIDRSDPQIDRNDPQIDAPADPPRMNQLDLEYLFQLIEKSYLKINETLDRIEKRFNNREIE